MSSESKEVLQRMVAVFNSGDVSGVNLIVSESYVDYQESEARANNGQQTFRSVVGRVRRSFPDVTVVIEDLVAEGDRVAGRLSWSGTDGCGRIFRAESFDVIRVEGRRAAEHWGISSAWPDHGR